jgi:hypothetical protein
MAFVLAYLWMGVKPGSFSNVSNMTVSSSAQQISNPTIPALIFSLVFYPDKWVNISLGGDTSLPPKKRHGNKGGRLRRGATQRTCHRPSIHGRKYISSPIQRHGNKGGKLRLEHIRVRSLYEIFRPVRNRSSSSDPLARKRRLNGAGGPSDKTRKTEVQCHSWYDTIKILAPCTKALSAEHRPKFCSPSEVMVASP